MTDESRDRGSGGDGTSSHQDPPGAGPARPTDPSPDDITLPNIFGGRRPDDDPDTIVENLTARITGAPPEPAPDRAWGELADSRSTPAAPPTRIQPAWSPQQAAWAAEAAGTPLPDDQDRRRRRRAGLAVLGVMVATVAVVGTAILVAPQWSSSTPDPDRSATTASSAPSTAEQSPSSSLPPATTATQPPPSSAAPTTRSSAPAPVTVTRTVTGGPPAQTTAGTPTKTAKPTKTATPTKTAKPTKAAAPKPTRPAADTSLGVPRQDIACSNGYVVQLASELTPDAFRARVSALKAAGQVPSGARVADSRSSCAIFSGQKNTLVLWAGPFGSAYDGCPQRLSGPADAFIKGAQPSTSRQFISCICRSGARGLPQIGPGSDQRGWIGELQRMLAGELNISVGELGAAQWGVYTDGTRGAVQRFQQQNRLPASGTVDAATWQAIGRAGC